MATMPLTMTVRVKTSAFDKIDVLAGLGIAALSTGTWRVFGWGWALIVLGCLLLAGAIMFAFAWAPSETAGERRADPS